LPSGGVGGEPEVDRLGGLTLAIVGVGAAAGLVGGGGEAGGGDGEGDGCGDGAGCGAGDGAGRGFGCGRARRLADGTAAAATTAGPCDDGASRTGANGPVATRTPPGPNGVTAAAGENADTTERCCAAGSASPPDDDRPT
jgi:hypothetical protein